MGVVYKAHDTKLDRIVALKFLPHHIAAGQEEQMRFLQEAKAAATLNHPNVCTIYDIREEGGEQFILMEYVDGLTLRQKMQQGLIPFRDTIAYALQIGEALQEAHSKGIVHRDIKAENIMVNTRNQIKVMDFGLAKLKGSLKLTRTSSTIGTLAYMAPEQLQGGETDARSDIFSFGVVLYEMLTGKAPFHGEHEAATMYSILNEEVTPASALRPEIPSEIDRIVRRSLEKDPEDRYQHADDMVSELRRLQKQTSRVVRPEVAPSPRVTAPALTRRPVKRWLGVAGMLALVVVAGVVLYRFLGPTGSTTAPEKKMLVVLPFENLGSPDQEYFADGITEEITSKLSGLSGLGVIARSSAMGYKKTSKSIKQIGQELGVSYILEGTIRWESENGVTHVRVNPQLINVADETQIWSQPSEAVLAGAFKLQSDIATQVASALNIRLLGQERQTLEARLTENAEAHDFYLRGNEYFYRSTGEQDIRYALQMYQRAIDLDPKFAGAYARLSEAHANMYWELYDHSEERLRQAREAAERALRLDNTLPDAHGAMAWYYYHGLREYDNALKEFSLALQAQPNNADVLLGIGSVYRREGKFEEALSNMQRAVDFNPRVPQLHVELALTYIWMRRYPDAEQSLDRAIAIGPEVPEGYAEKALLLLLWRGDVGGARRVLVEARRQRIDQEDSGISYVSVLTEIMGGAYDQARDLLHGYHFDAFTDQFWYVPKDLLLAGVYSSMGKASEARTSYTAAKTLLERELKRSPDDARLHSSLGIACAGLGLNEQAIREGQLAVSIIPLSKEAMIVPLRMQDMALIYTMTGNQEAALSLLQQLVTMPTTLSAALLRLDPSWAPLRSNPGFQKLIAEKGVQ